MTAKVFGGRDGASGVFDDRVIPAVFDDRVIPASVAEIDEAIVLGKNQGDDYFAPLEQRAPDFEPADSEVPAEFGSDAAIDFL